MNKKATAGVSRARGAITLLVARAHVIRKLATRQPRTLRRRHIEARTLSDNEDGGHCLHIQVVPVRKHLGCLAKHCFVLAHLCLLIEKHNSQRPLKSPPKQSDLEDVFSILRNKSVNAFGKRRGLVCSEHNFELLVQSDTTSNESKQHSLQKGKHINFLADAPKTQ